MKMQIVNRKSLMIFGLAFLVSLVFSVNPALATDFEVGTQFGISHIIPDGDDEVTESSTLTEIPSGIINLGLSPTSLYTMWFPTKRFAIGPEFQFARMTTSSKFFGEKESESVTSLYLGGRAAHFLRSHSVSNPFVLGRISLTALSGDIFPDDGGNIFSFGAGLGYQWRVGSALVLRMEGLYQRLLLPDDESGNAFRLVIGLGTRFEKDDDPAPLK